MSFKSKSPILTEEVNIKGKFKNFKEFNTSSVAFQNRTATTITSKKCWLTLRFSLRTSKNIIKCLSQLLSWSYSFTPFLQNHNYSFEPNFRSLRWLQFCCIDHQHYCRRLMLSRLMYWLLICYTRPRARGLCRESSRTKALSKGIHLR